jgi:phosphoenolpyruvate carboxykinase (GTP)
MADYMAHWLEIGREADAAKLPRLFYVNWFRKGPDGKFLWPGYGENSRVLEWVFERCAGRGEAVKTPIGYLPADGTIDIDGLAVPPEAMNELLKVDPDEWRQELESIAAHFERLGDRIPPELLDELTRLEKRLS